MSPVPVTFSGRIPPALLEAAKQKAASEGVTVTSVIIRALERYVNKK